MTGNDPRQTSKDAPRIDSEPEDEVRLIGRRKTRSQGKHGILTNLLLWHQRIAIAGGPRTGKTTISGQVSDRPVFHTDDTMDLPWEDQPVIWIGKVEMLSQFVIEGVQVARCLRKGMQVDAVLWLTEPCVTRTRGQATMAKAHDKIFNDWWEASLSVPVYRYDASR